MGQKADISFSHVEHPSGSPTRRKTSAPLIMSLALSPPGKALLPSTHERYLCFYEIKSFLFTVSFGHKADTALTSTHDDDHDLRELETKIGAILNPHKSNSGFSW
ncbi:hypothetical protein HK16_14115 [Acetobacter senegalensis]|uniref:Uncharacterized protein n=2 Tax=Acetobacter TaxID=434 RepID=A0A149U014_9PROT|nr:MULTISPECIES: hypothetical protein [Acetobacter]ATJ89811.1 hypothetical protein CIW82_02950 [Acetobacter tropicalis]KXV58773.1 hypothetical protein AD948_10615 [Acetobacter senegalensis]OUL65770.1 hypothetical protein HK16_14115 [Acetobacter senegalensis]